MAKTAREDLADTIANSMNKLFKDGTVAYVRDEETPTDLTDFLPTGCALLDLAISNRPHGGIAFGRITELTGLEGSGKSLLTAHMMANVQKMGGVAVLIDTETAVNWDFFEAVGVDRSSNWVYAYLNTVEDIFSATENIIETVRKSDKKKPVIIVIDSLAGATTKVENEGDYEKSGYGTEKAMLIGKALRKITQTIGEEKIALVITNQLRQKMNAMPFSDPWIAPGGKALDFFTSTIIRLAITGKITKKDKDDETSKSKSKEVIGVKAKATVTKNRLGPPHRTAEFSIFFDRGIDDYSAWLQFLRDKNIITGRANKLIYVTENGEEVSFSEKEWNQLLEENSNLKEEVYLKLCETCIMSYKSDGVVVSDTITLETDE